MLHCTQCSPGGFGEQGWCTPDTLYTLHSLVTIPALLAGCTRGNICLCHSNCHDTCYAQHSRGGHRQEDDEEHSVEALGLVLHGLEWGSYSPHFLRLQQHEAQSTMSASATYASYVITHTRHTGLPHVYHLVTSRACPCEACAKAQCYRPQAYAQDHSRALCLCIVGCQQL
jgi:hypothetical protein